MNRRTNIINNILLIVFALAAILAVTLVGSDAYSDNIGWFILWCILGAVFWALVNLCVHEWGHIAAAKRNGFKVLSVRLGFLRFYKENGKTKAEYAGFDGESGSTETVPVGEEKLEERFIRLTRAGVYGNIVFAALTLVPLFLTAYLPFWLYSVWAIGLPVSLYYVVGNGFPMTTDGVKNDAAVISGVKKGNDSEKVMLSLLLVHAELAEGKRPSEIDEKLYFGVPQLPEDDMNYLLLLNARYAYYLDKEDFEGAKKVSSRLAALLDTMPKPFRPAVRVDLLYNACTFDFDESEADNLVEDNEKYLNRTSDVTVVRVKAAYVLYVLKDAAQAEKFLSHAQDLLADCKVEGQKKFEERLIGKMLADVSAAKNAESAETGGSEESGES